MALVVFDLDGTLIDSKRDLANAVNAMLEHFGRAKLAAETVYRFVGNGAPVLVRRALGGEPGEQEAAEALQYFYAYYREHMLDHTVAYPGVREALESLREAGTRMAVLTNKPVRFSEDIVRGLGLDRYFFRVYGGNSFEHKKPHPVGIETLLKESGETKDRAWMVGDSAVDVKTARHAGIAAAGVTYGFQPETLVEEPPDMLLDDLREFPAAILAP
jgi:phosphoglycolate phosphatase